MPIYEYKCRKCNVHIEAMQKINDRPLSKCRSCGGRLEKLWSQTSFQFKGSGWYVTDYARKTGEKGSSEAPAKEKDSDKTSTAESTSKPKTPSSPAGD